MGKIRNERQRQSQKSSQNAWKNTQTSELESYNGSQHIQNNHLSLSATASINVSGADVVGCLVAIASIPDNQNGDWVKKQFELEQSHRHKMETAQLEADTQIQLKHIGANASAQKIGMILGAGMVVVIGVGLFFIILTGTTIQIISSFTGLVIAITGLVATVKKKVNNEEKQPKINNTPENISLSGNSSPNSGQK